MLETYHAARLLVAAARQAGTLCGLGDLPGHPFHGNQWTTGQAEVSDQDRQTLADYQEHTWNKVQVTNIAKQTIPGGKYENLHPGAITVYRGVDKGSISSSRSGSWTKSRAVAEVNGSTIHELKLTKDMPALDINKALGETRHSHEQEVYVVRSIRSFSSLCEDLTALGGKGSGNFGHAGRPGEVGGSAPSGGEASFLEAGQRGLETMSRTAKGAYDNTQQVGKPALASTTDLAARAVKNNAEALRFAWAHRNTPATEVKTVVEGIAQRELRGMFTSDNIWRQVPGKDFPYASPETIASRMREFYAEFAKRADSDPVATAAWVEQVLLTDIHPFVDAVGRTSRAVSAWTLARAGVPLPEYRNKEAYARAINKSLAEFTTYYRTLIPVKALGGSGSGNFGHAGRPGEVGGSGAGATAVRSEKSLRALKYFKPIHAAAQRHSEANELIVREMLGGTRTNGNHPMDVIATIDGKRIGVEVKTMINNTNDKITVRAAALKKKEQWARRNRADIHTVVIDDRNHAHQIYYKKGAGSFRMNTMTLVKSGDHLKELIAQ